MTTQEQAAFKKSGDDLVTAHNQLTQSRETHSNTLKLADKQNQNITAAQAAYAAAVKAHEELLKTIN